MSKVPTKWQDVLSRMPETRMGIQCVSVQVAGKKVEGIVISGQDFRPYEEDINWSEVTKIQLIPERRIP